VPLPFQAPSFFVPGFRVVGARTKNHRLALLSFPPPQRLTHISPSIRPFPRGSFLFGIFSFKTAIFLWPGSFAWWILARLFLLLVARQDRLFPQVRCQGFLFLPPPVDVMYPPFSFRPLLLIFFFEGLPAAASSARQGPPFSGEIIPFRECGFLEIGSPATPFFFLYRVLRAWPDPPPLFSLGNTSSPSNMIALFSSSLSLFFPPLGFFLA